MVDITQAVTAITYLRDFTKWVRTLREDAAVLTRVNEANERVGEVLDKLQELRGSNLNLLEGNRKLTAQIEAANNWKERLATHTHVRTSGGAVVLKNSDEVLVCPACAESKREIQALQPVNNMVGDFACPRCKATFPVGEWTATPRPLGFA